MLGVTIGVAAVIATVAVGAGATERIQPQIASLGRTDHRSARHITTIRNTPRKWQCPDPTEDDARAIATQCSWCQRGGACRSPGPAGYCWSYNWLTSILGGCPRYLTIRELGVDRGCRSRAKMWNLQIALRC